MKVPRRKPNRGRLWLNDGSWARLQECTLPVFDLAMRDIVPLYSRANSDGRPTWTQLRSTLASRPVA